MSLSWYLTFRFNGITSRITYIGDYLVYICCSFLWSYCKMHFKGFFMLLYSLSYSYMSNNIVFPYIGWFLAVSLDCSLIDQSRHSFFYLDIICMHNQAMKQLLVLGQIAYITWSGLHSFIPFVIILLNMRLASVVILGYPNEISFLYFVFLIAMSSYKVGGQRVMSV